MKIISVIPLRKGILKGDLTYFSSLDIQAGDIVYVPLRNKKTLALVTRSDELRDAKSGVKGMNFNLRKVSENKGKSIFRKEYLETIFETSMYFVQNYNNAFSSLIPKIFIEEYDKISHQDIKIIDPNRDNLQAEKLLFQYPLLDRISVYKTLIRESFARGKSIFIVMPTELDIDKFSEYLSKGIENFAFSLHSGNTPKKNLLHYQKIMSEEHPVLIIATTAFLSIPRGDLGTIILEHESSSAYRTIARPHLDLRIFIEIFASKIKAKLILADEILRYETIARKELDNLNPLHPISYRVEFEGAIETLSREKKQIGDKFKILEDSSILQIKNTLERKKNVFIFSLRKGLSTMTVCRDCRNIISCDKCSSPLVLYTSSLNKKKLFLCNKCGDEKDPNTVCDSCGSWNLVPLGIGTDTVYEYAKELFPGTKIFKLDKESAKTALGAKKIAKEFEDSKGSILIGTEMALFYLKEKVVLSLIASFDSLWSIPNFRMGEKILKILISIVNITTEKLVIQAKNTNDGAINALEKRNLLSFVREELEDRNLLGYPPYKKFIKVIFFGSKEDTQKAREALKEIFREYSPEIFSGFIPKIKDKYATNMLIKLDLYQWSLPSLKIGGNIDQNLFKKLSGLPDDFQVMVDPEDLL